MLQWHYITLSILFILYLLLHMKMKKLLVGTFLWMFAVAWVAVLPSVASADDWYAPNPNKNLVSDGQELTGSKFLDTVKSAINWILWILATVALVMCLYGWFKMVTAAGDEKKYGDGLKVLKYAAIWLGIVGLSWMIVSVVFRFVWTLSWWNQVQTADSWNVVESNNGSIWWSQDVQDNNG